jgi:hypothetical protein
VDLQREYPFWGRRTGCAAFRRAQPGIEQALAEEFPGRLERRRADRRCFAAAWLDDTFLEGVDPRL